MNGNIHVQFLGEGVAATSPPYPTVRYGVPGTTSVPPVTPISVLLAPSSQSRRTSFTRSMPNHHSVIRFITLSRFSQTRV